MSTTSAAGARHRDHDPRAWIAIAAAVAVVVLALALVIGSALRSPQSVEHQIGNQVYAGTGCVIKVMTNEGVVRRWPQASKAEMIVCQTSENDQFANDVMDYAQFKSATALSARLKTAPPDGSYCRIGDVVVSLDEHDRVDSFGPMCAQRGGALHEAAG